MGVRIGSVVTSTALNVLPANATETIILTTPPIGLAVDNAGVVLIWQLSAIAGTGTTSWVIRIRRGALLTGTDITLGGITQSFVATNGGIFSGNLVDLPGVVAGQQYSLTVVQTGATAAGTLGTQLNFLAMVL